MMLSVVFQEKKTSEEFFRIYQEFLSDLTDKIIEDAIKSCLVNCRFFPTIAEIREHATPGIKAEQERRNEEFYQKNKIDIRGRGPRP